MRFALVTTTIRVPALLAKYRELGPDVHFIVAGDRKSPHREILDLLNSLGGYVYLTPEDQEKRYPALSEAIGWDCIQRRNLAILEAAKLDPDVIVSIDDDNEAMGDYFKELEAAFSEPHRGFVAEGPWFNVGELADEPFTYRGFPRTEMPVAWKSTPQNGHPREVGVVNGLIYGDPDIDATQRLEVGPVVNAYDQSLVEYGVALKPSETFSPLNSQNTAWRAELAPLMLLPPRVGRYDDIWGSYIAQKVLSATGYHVLFGKPLVEQQRNPHDLYQDLEDELYGMRNNQRFLDCLADISLGTEDSIRENLGVVLTSLHDTGLDLPFDFFREWLAAWDQ